MALIYKRPTDLVRHFTTPGLQTTVGPVSMNRYMSGSISNGGNETAVSFYANTRSRLHQAGIRNDEIDILLKGQGSPHAMLKVMNFIVANKTSLTFRFEVKHREGPAKETLLQDYGGSFYDRYFGDGSSDQAALQKMVKDGIFGVDCVGFVANWMIFAGVWDKYYGYEIYQWNKLFTEKIKSYDDIDDMCITVWGKYHIAIIDSISDYVDKDRSTKVVLCQSSSGGPRSDGITLAQSGTGYATQFDVQGTVPVKGLVSIWRKPNLKYARPVSPLSASSNVPSPVGRWDVRVDRWLWIYTFAAGGVVAWQDPSNGEGGTGTWTMQEDVGQMVTAWVGSTTTETWDLPLNADSSSDRVRMKGILYDLAAVKKA